jgi:uncharacterized protein
LTDMPKSRAYRLFARYVGFAERHTLLVLAVLLALAGGAAYLALKLELHTDFAELLPDNHQAILAFKRIAGRQKSATNLVMLIHSPDEEANQKLAEALRPELTKMIPDTFGEIQWKPDTEIPDHAAKWKWMYAEKKDLENAEDLLDRVIGQRASPFDVPIDDDPEAELKKLRERLNQKLPPQKMDASGTKPLSYFSMKEKDEHWLGIMMWRRRDGLATRGDHETLRLVFAAVAKVDPKKYHPKMVVEYTGHIAQALDEQKGIRDDLQVATILCAALVLLSIFMYFRRFALLLVVGAPAVLGLLLALALASVTIHYLNVSTAFLISIILGNGINTPIILLARYGEERRRGQPVPDALKNAMAEALLGTLTAMIAASIAYGSLLLTSFRGFNQFGLIGGAGMLIVWVVTFILVPPMVIFGERIKPGLLTPRGNLWRAPFAWIGKQCAERPWVPVGVSVILLALAFMPGWRFLSDPLEWDFNNLRTDAAPSQNNWGRMEQLGMGDVGAGYIGNNGVLLVDKPEEADPVADAMKKQDEAQGPKHVLAAVRTVKSVLPKDQEEKLEILARIRKKIDKQKDRMDDSERAEVMAWRPPEYLRTLTTDDLPRQVREAFTEVDGQFGRLIGIDADNKTYYDWNGHDLLRMSKALKVEALGKTWVAASAATIFAGMLESILADGPRVTIAALVGIVVLVLIAFGFSGALPVLVTLAIGMVWLGGLAGWLKMKVNFMNFVAIPITIGVGADYAANIWARLKAEGADNITGVVGDTGSAVALCSTTTIIGYSSLLMSHNRALRSFGLAADIGEITCLLAALIALPAIFRLLKRK